MTAPSSRSTRTSNNPDRPLLRIFQPPLAIQGPPTIRNLYESLLAPEANAYNRRDHRRYLGYWEKFEKLVADELRLGPRTGPPTSQGAAVCTPLCEVESAQPAEEGTELGITIDQVTSSVVTAFRDWISSPEQSGSQDSADFAVGLGMSASTSNKAVGLIKTIVAIAGDEGYEVKPIRTRRLKTNAAPKYYLDDLQMALLWSACDGCEWPPQQAFRSFGGSGMSPSVFWRSVLILLRTYGMRVQDLVAYAKGKSPVCWKDVTWQPRTHNPEGKAESPLGWLYYKASKTGREHYLPLTRASRAALDRLARAASEATAVAIEDLPSSFATRDRPILPCPKSHSLNAQWKLLQSAAGVRTPRGGGYDLEDFRKTCATYLLEVHADLPYLVCGWSTARSAIATKHYLAAERTLVRHLPAAPFPGCFQDWID